MWWQAIILGHKVAEDDLQHVQSRSAFALVGTACLILFILLCLGGVRLWVRLRLRPCPHCREFIDREAEGCPRCGKALSRGWASAAGSPEARRASASTGAPKDQRRE